MEANSLVIRGGNVVTEDAILPNHDSSLKTEPLRALRRRLPMLARLTRSLTRTRRAWWLTGKLVFLWWMRVAPMWFQA